MNKDKIEEKCYELLFNKYQKLVLSKDEVAELLNISTRTLDRRKANNSDLPKFKIIDGTYCFSLEAITKYHCELAS